MTALQGLDLGTVSFALMLLLGIVGALIGIAVQLIILRLAMFFPPIRALVRWILDAAEK